MLSLQVNKRKGILAPVKMPTRRGGGAANVLQGFWREKIETKLALYVKNREIRYIISTKIYNSNQRLKMLMINFNKKYEKIHQTDQQNSD